MNVLDYETSKFYGNGGTTASTNLIYLENQTLSYEESFKLTFSRRLQLSSFPVDSHECKLDITIAKLTDDLSKLIMRPLHISYYNPTMFEKLSYELKIESDESKVYDYEETTYPLISMILRLKRKSLRHLTSKGCCIKNETSPKLLLNPIPTELWNDVNY